jgi:serine protease Do
MSKGKFHGYRLAAALALVAAVGLGALIERSGATANAPPEVDPTTLRHAEQLSEAFHNAAAIAMPSVVTIRSKAKAHPVANNRGNGQQGENPFKGTPFEDFFKDRGFDFHGQMPNMPRREGMGSGVIIDSSGIVLTNNHVVEGADEVVVHLADGREFKADDIKTDPETDMAVIRIHGAGSLPAAKLGDSDLLRIGDWVIAIGSPFELDQTVSAGIISGQGRELSSIRRAKFLQTDAAINPGNSGGPLVNLKGEVVGINTAIATNSGSFNGIGFAVPSNLAKWVTGHLIAKGSVQRAYLGVGISDLTSDLAEKLGAKEDGVLVTQVHPKTPAAEAGFKAGDVITSCAGQKVSGPRELQEMVERVPLDEKRDVEVLRQGKTMKLTVTAKALPADAFEGDSQSQPSSRQPVEPGNYAVDDMGIEVSDLTAEQASAMKLEHGGVMITNVDANKPAFEAGLRRGMVILMAGQQEVKDVASFKAAMEGQSVKDKVLLYVQVRPGQNAFVVVKE